MQSNTKYQFKGIWPVVFLAPAHCENQGCRKGYYSPDVVIKCFAFVVVTAGKGNRIGCFRNILQTLF